MGERYDFVFREPARVDDKLFVCRDGVGGVDYPLYNDDEEEQEGAQEYAVLVFPDGVESDAEHDCQ